MEMVIRAATEKDVPVLILLLQLLGYEWQENELQLHLNKLRQYQSEVLLAVSKDQPEQIIGCINPLIDQRLAEGCVGEIVSLAVFEEYQGQGAGRLLLCAAEDWLKSRVSQVRIRANAKRQAAHEFYRRAGYEPDKTQQIFYKKL